MEYRVIRTKRKTMCLQVDPEGHVIVRAPQLMPEWMIKSFVEKNSGWIEKQLKKLYENRTHAVIPESVGRSVSELKKAARADLAERTEKFARIMKVSYGKISIRHQKTRWGSCSSGGNISYNCILMCLEPELRDYVVVHELAHRIEMNHSQRFWAVVERNMPDYRIRHKKLKKLSPADFATSD